MMGTGIPWCDETINPIVGCSKCSPGCDNCYAQRMAWRQAHNTKTRPETRAAYRDVTVDGEWSGRTVWRPSELEKVNKWRSPKRIFVCSMSDPFHESVKWEWILGLNKFFAAHPQHTFMLLTKRPWRAVRFQNAHKSMKWSGNVWMGVTVCNQEEADGKIPIFSEMDVKVRFASVEPILGKIDLCPHLCKTVECDDCEWTGYEENMQWPGDKVCIKCGKSEVRYTGRAGLDWVICGGETGPGARKIEDDYWVERVWAECDEEGIPFFFKGWGGVRKKKGNGLIGGKRYQEFPQGKK